jgi:hypothetical protein
MSGMNTIRLIKRLEKECSELGLVMVNPKNGFYNTEYGDTLALIPKDNDALPIYCRDAELFRGSLEELQVWLRGVEWARQYDQMLKVSDSKKRERKEQDLRNRQLVALLREESLNLKSTN